jgi:hypothetical protein
MSSNKGHGHELLPKPDNPAWAQWFWSNRLGLMLGFGVVVMVLGFRLLRLADSPANIEDIANEMGSVAEFWGEPSPNHKGTGIVYQQSTETGVGVFFTDIPSGSRKLLYELPEKFAIKDRGAQNLNVWDWSPDDSLFAFSHLNGTNRLIVVCNGQTGERESEARVSRQIKGLVWLDADTVAFVNEKDDLYYWGAGPSRRGSSLLSFVKKGGKKPEGVVRNLTALSADTIAWHDGSGIWSWKFGNERPAHIWSGPTNIIVEMGLSPGGQSFWLRHKDAEGETVVRVPVAGGRHEELRRIKALANQTNKNHIVWFQKGFANAWGGVATRSLSIYPTFGATPQELVFRGGILSYVSSGNSLYLMGSLSGEPPGIWRYNGDVEKMTCVVSNGVPNFKTAKPVAPERGEFVCADGSKIVYWLWSPPRLREGKTYPLLVGGPCWGWDGYRTALVNGGAYLINLDRDDWYADWTEGVPELIEHLKGTLKLDEKQKYLFGTSAQVHHASRLLELEPDKWRGILMFSPGGGGPAFESLKNHRLFIDCGADDRYSEYALKYRDAAVKRGADITTVVHQDAEHTYRSIRSTRSRDKAAMKFIYGR